MMTSRNWERLLRVSTACPKWIEPKDIVDSYYVSSPRGSSGSIAAARERQARRSISEAEEAAKAASLDAATGDVRPA